MIAIEKVKTLIIEDNPQSKKYLMSLIFKHFPNLEVAQICTSVKQSVEAINKSNPELILMDIELTDGNSFEIFKQLTYHDFEVVFITAHDNFVKKALEHYAFSFITKPYTEDTLVKTINHYIKLKKRLFTQHKYLLLTEFLHMQNASILIQVSNVHLSININDIVKCEADGNYTLFVLTNGKSYLASNTLKYYEGLLSSKGFFKARRSAIVNIKHIASIYKKETIILKNKDRIQVSIRNKSRLTELINALS